MYYLIGCFSYRYNQRISAELKINNLEEMYKFIGKVHLFSAALESNKKDVIKKVVASCHNILLTNLV